MELIKIRKRQICSTLIKISALLSSSFWARCDLDKISARVVKGQIKFYVLADKICADMRRNWMCEVNTSPISSGVHRFASFAFVNCLRQSRSAGKGNETAMMDACENSFIFNWKFLIAMMSAANFSPLTNGLGANHNSNSVWPQYRRAKHTNDLSAKTQSYDEITPLTSLGVLDGKLLAANAHGR